MPSVVIQGPYQIGASVLPAVPGYRYRILDSLITVSAGADPGSTFEFLSGGTQLTGPISVVLGSPVKVSGLATEYGESLGFTCTAPMGGYVIFAVERQS